MKIPHTVEGGAEGLALALTNQWPSYLSFVTSFCTILIMWGNHHEVFRLVRRANTGFMLANGFLLMVVTVVPFTTALIIVGVLGFFDKMGRSREPLFLSRGVTRFSFPPRRIAVREGSPVAAQTAVFFGV